MLVIVVIFQFFIPLKVQNSHESERRNTEVETNCKKIYMKQKREKRKFEY